MNTNQLLFRVNGEPQGKGRPRFTRGGTTYTPQKTKRYEQQIREAALQAATVSGYLKPDNPVSVNICAWFVPPKSWSKKKRRAAMAGELYPTVKPDADNLAKVFLDALNEIAYHDDKQVVDCVIRKRYTFQPDEVPHVVVHIEPKATLSELKAQSLQQAAQNEPQAA